MWFELLLVLLVSTETLASWNKNDTLPIMMLHVGPHKTGTTHFQSFLVDNEKELKSHKILIWPKVYPTMQKCMTSTPSLREQQTFRGGRKELTSFFPFFSQCPSFHRLITEFVTQAARRRETVIFCHEEWAGQMLENPAAVESFMALASAHFRVHVVMNYRLSVNRYVSVYNEMMKPSLRRGYIEGNKWLCLFSDFMSFSESPASFYPRVIAAYRGLTDSHPNADLTVVDYYGVGATTGGEKMDLNFVMMCKILGVFCGKGRIFSSDIGANPSVQEAPLQMAMLFIAYADRRNCKVPQENVTFITSLYTHGWQGDIPMVDVDLSEVASVSLREDASLRQVYQSHFLLPNRTANVAQAKWKHAEVSERAVSADPRWQSQFSDLLRSHRAQGLCH